MTYLRGTVAGLIVHEWVEQRGGAETVVDGFVGAFPDAALYCLWDDTYGERYPTTRLFETWLARTPLRGRKAMSLPLMIPAWTHVPIKDPDWMLISSHLFAHQVRRPSPGVPKVVYVHTPARYIWAPEYDPRGGRLAARLASPALRAIDRRRLDGDLYVANSRFIRDRIMASWDVQSEVLHPPVDVERIQSVDRWREHLGDVDRETLDALPSDFLLGASRFVRYKRLDKVIAMGEATGLPVVLAGGGPDEQDLRAHAAEAGVPVELITNPSDELLYALYQRAIAYIFPAVEDFGIMPMEAIAAGTPAVVNEVGGAREGVEAVGGGSVLRGEEGVHYVEALEEALSADRSEMVKSVRHFGNMNFERRIAAIMRDAVSATIGER